ncbi:Bug family tripartite tricarboxylate transporter substrate binding protein [Variovorax paradoxus]|uniref:Bug family tripartite tricarboxylate transporter substrate binding protein n=1 Tax=Variovorax paradoxus TaxID=34073 RepID=UPI002784B233|nr:tripartite tricarboxylate transporter substrate binding protein [Variovorax paradoxus]MDQ0588608.1 tripartite-type tricarboxylate transporter receptor subunit TctC [Variovorax paradoxus]
MSINRRAAVLLPLLLCAAPWPAHAQAYPEKPIHVVVPFAPGGPADAVARILGQELVDTLGQPFIIDNKVGAAGNIGVAQIAKAAPDGYTLGIVPVGNVAVNPSLFPSLPYKVSELQPVAMLAVVENVLVVHASVPASSVKELLALARQKPGTLSFASPGAGSQAHLAGELMALDGDVQLIHVPYKGIGPALNDVVGGQVTMMFGSLSAVLPFVKSGKLRAIGLASLKRSAAMPELPTVAEQGLPGFEAISWYALMAPAGTPKAIVDRLNAETARVLAKPEMKEKFAGLGLEPGTGKPQDIAANIQSESARWSAVIRKRNIKPE